MIDTKSDWGDRFQAMVPDTVKAPAGCNCDRLRTLMNQCNAKEADQMFDYFAKAITENASKTFLSMLPVSAVRFEIERRLGKAYYLAFGFKRQRNN